MTEIYIGRMSTHHRNSIKYEQLDNGGIFLMSKGNNPEYKSLCIKIDNMKYFCTTDHGTLDVNKGRKNKTKFMIDLIAGNPTVELPDEVEIGWK